METLADLVDRDRRTEEDALLVDGQQAYTYHRFCTRTWKAGNFLRHLGVRDGTTVAVAPDRAAQPLLALFGTVLLGGVVRLDPSPSVDARAVVAHADDVGGYELPAGGQRAGYGGDPTSSEVYHFEEEVWSENPTRVPRTYDPDSAVVTDGNRSYSHGDLLGAAAVTVDRLGLADGDSVLVRGSLGDPRTIAAGVLAPLSVGGVVVLSDDGPGDAVVRGPSVGGSATEQSDGGDEVRSLDVATLPL